MKLPCMAIALTLVACGGPAPDVKKSAEGETCSSTDQCAGDLRCVAAVCTSSGPDANGANAGDATADADATLGADAEADAADASSTDVADVAGPSDTMGDAAPDVPVVDGSADVSADVQVDSQPDVLPDVWVDPCAAKNCDDGNVCTDDNCLGGVCSHGTNTLPCDDGSPCTKDDKCVGGSCGATAPCDDGNPCTLDVCAAGSCQYAAAPKPCTPPGTCISKACDLPGSDPTLCVVSACGKLYFQVGGKNSLCACDNLCTGAGDCCADYQAFCK